MTIRTLISIATVFLAFVSIDGQTKRSSKSRKPIVIRESVTVKGDLPTAEPPLRETDRGAWRKFEFAEHKLTIEIPAKTNDGMTMDEPDADGLWSIASDTEKATYRVVIRDIAAILDRRSAEEVLNDSISKAYGGTRQGAESAKIREVTYKGRPGREIITNEKERVQIGRVFIVEQKIYALFVTINRRDQWPTMEPWARRFLESFKVELPIGGEA